MGARRRHLVVIALVCSIACSRTHIPNRVTADEYDVYSQFLLQRFAKKAPANLQFWSVTVPFVLDERCFEDIEKNNKIPSALIRQQKELGQATSPLDIQNGRDNLMIPWPHSVVYSIKEVHTSLDLHLMSFSRVAFNRAHTEALFSFGDICGGDCGHGAPIYARKKNGKWEFTNVNTCSWVS